MFTCSIFITCFISIFWNPCALRCNNWREFGTRLSKNIVHIAVICFIIIVWRCLRSRSCIYFTMTVITIIKRKINIINIVMSWSRSCYPNIGCFEFILINSICSTSRIKWWCLNCLFKSVVIVHTQPRNKCSHCTISMKRIKIWEDGITLIWKLWNSSKSSNQYSSSLFSHVFVVFSINIWNHSICIILNDIFIHPRISHNSHDKFLSIIKDLCPVLNSLDIWLHSLTVLKVRINIFNHLTNVFNSRNKSLEILIFQVL